MEHYEETLKTLRAELADLEKKAADITAKYKAEMDGIEDRITRVKSGIVSMSGLLKKVDQPVRKKAGGIPLLEAIQAALDEHIGISAAIREVLKASTSPMSPADIREALVGIGYDVTQHSNVLASIHTCLKRLKSNEEVRSLDDSGKAVYEWKR